MDLLSLLYSTSGDKQGNYKVAEMCTQEPMYIMQIVAGMQEKDPKIVGDCAEVLTEIAKTAPEIVTPHALSIPPLFKHRNGRARWESLHCLGLIADRVPGLVVSLLPDLLEIIRNSDSVIMRDYAIDAVAGLASVSPDTAGLALPVLREGLTVWEGRHAGHALAGIRNAEENLPELADELRTTAEGLKTHSNSSVQKLARQILKAM